MESLMIMLN